jgi:hypothetical protein
MKRNNDKTKRDRGELILRNIVMYILILIAIKLAMDIWELIGCIRSGI